MTIFNIYVVVSCCSATICKLSHKLVKVKTLVHNLSKVVCFGDEMGYLSCILTCWIQTSQLLSINYSFQDTSRGKNSRIRGSRRPYV